MLSSVQIKYSERSAIVKEFRDTWGPFYPSGNISSTGNGKLLFMNVKYRDIYIYIYVCELYIHEKWELIGRTYIIWKQFIFYFEQIYLRKTFLYKVWRNQDYRGRYDERGDRMFSINTINDELKPICNLLATLEDNHIFHNNRI